MKPTDALSPRDKLDAQSLNVIHTHPQGWWSLARMTYDNAERVGIRWNGDINDPDDKGNPRSHNHGTWFVLPDELGGPVAALAETFSKKYK